MRQPPRAGATIEEFLAAVLARAARLLAGALIARLGCAFPAIGPAQHPAGLAMPVMPRQCTELASKAGAGASDDDG